jgi:hypothetical protein
LADEIDRMRTAAEAPVRRIKATVVARDCSNCSVVI